MLEPQMPPDEDERLASLYRLALLDTDAEARFDRIARIATLALGMPMAAISLIDSDRQWFKSRLGMAATETPRRVSFCGHAILGNDLFVVGDARRDPRFADNPLVMGDPEIGFYVGCPLDDGEGHKLAVLCVMDHRPRVFTPRESALLKELGSWAEQELRSVGLERALQENEEILRRLDAITESLIDGFLTVDGTGSVLTFNNAAGQIFDRDRHEVIGQGIEMLIQDPPLQPIGDVSAADLGLMVEDAVTTAPFLVGAGSVRETLGVRKDGTDFPIEVAVSVTIADGSPLYLVIVRDITARRQAEEAIRHSEEQHRAQSDAAPIGIFRTDPTGACEYVNRRFIELSGMSLEQVRGGGPGTLHPDDAGRIVQEWEDAVLTGGEYASEYRFEPPGGRTTWVRSHASPQYAPDGRITGYLGVVEDITDQRAVDLMKNQFVSLVSHELRTPLTSIRGALGLLAGGAFGPLDEAPQRMLDIAVANTDRLVRLLNDILDIERIESGAVGLVRHTVDVKDLVEQSIDVMAPMADKAGVGLEATAHHTRLWVDPDRIIQTLTNLMSNAIKFSPPGATIRLTTAEQDGFLILEVADQGRGIPADKIDSVFGRFQQVDASDSRDKGGTGLGLAICKSIVEQHGGRISVRSVFGEGSTFTVCLPLSASSASEAASPGPMALVLGAAGADITRIRDALAERGCTVGMPDNPDVALPPEETRPDVVLLDLARLGPGGWRLLAGHQTERVFRGVPVIVFGPPEAHIDDALGHMLEAGRDVTSALLIGTDEALIEAVEDALSRRGIGASVAHTSAQTVNELERTDLDLLLIDLDASDEVWRPFLVAPTEGRRSLAIGVCPEPDTGNRSGDTGHGLRLRHLIDFTTTFVAREHRS